METIRNTISENLGGPAHALASPENSFSLDEVPDLSGKVNASRPQQGTRLTC